MELKGTGKANNSEWASGKMKEKETWTTLKGESKAMKKTVMCRETEKANLLAQDKSHRFVFHVKKCCVYKQLFSRTKQLRVIKLFLARAQNRWQDYAQCTPFSNGVYATSSLCMNKIYTILYIYIYVVCICIYINIAIHRI